MTAAPAPPLAVIGRFVPLVIRSAPPFPLNVIRVTVEAGTAA